jgi:hypothetical protein
MAAPGGKKSERPLCAVAAPSPQLVSLGGVMKRQSDSFEERRVKAFANLWRCICGAGCGRMDGLIDTLRGTSPIAGSVNKMVF